MAAWGKSREQREAEQREALAKVDADLAEFRKPDGEGATTYAARSFGEDLLVLLGGAAIVVVCAVVGLLVGDTVGLALGVVVGVVLCGLIWVVALVSGVRAWRRRR